MGKFRVKIEKLAEIHISQHYKSGNKAIIKKISDIIVSLSEDPYHGPGRPEPLKYELQGYWSRRITQKDRMIYKVHDAEVTVLVISASGHYFDK